MLKVTWVCPRIKVCGMMAGPVGWPVRCSVCTYMLILWINWLSLIETSYTLLQYVWYKIEYSTIGYILDRYLIPQQC